MNAFSPEMINMHRAEMEHQAQHHRLIKTARATCVSWLRRVSRGVRQLFTQRQAQRRQARQAEAWATAERIAASNPHLTASNC